MTDTPETDDLASPKYLDLSEIPASVNQAAETLFMFFEEKGMKSWQFSYVADRRLVVQLERERDDESKWAAQYKAERDEARREAEAWRSAWRLKANIHESKQGLPWEEPNND